MIFLAVHHVNEVASSTFNLIDQALGRFSSIEVMVLEGFPREFGISPNRIVELFRNDGSDGFFKGGETSYIVRKSRHLGIPFVGTERSEFEVKTAMIQKGYAELDLLYFYFVRAIPQLSRNGSLKSESIENLFQRTIKRDLKDLEITSDAPNYDDFLKWYRQKNKIEFKVNEISYEITAPLLDGTLFTQKLSAAVGQLRDYSMAETIAEMLNRFDTVLVVFGGSHWAPQAKIFEDWFGKPKEIGGL